MHIFGIFIFFTCSMFANKQAPPSNPPGIEYQSNPDKQDNLPPELLIHTNLAKQQALEQTMKVFNKVQACKCLKYSGNALIACMDYADKNEVRQTFGKMSYYARIDYLMTMNLLEYKRFLNAFDDEKQWKETLHSLPSDEQKLLPQTLLEQLILIRDTWISCAGRTPGTYSKGSKDPKANDLTSWRNKALEGYEKMHKDCPLLWQWLDERFLEQKTIFFQSLKDQIACKKGSSS